MKQAATSPRSASGGGPPVLASTKLANGETVYVELSPEGQRKMGVEGTIVQLSNSDVAERHRHDKGIKWMSLNP